MVIRQHPQDFYQVEYCALSFMIEPSALKNPASAGQNQFISNQDILAQMSDDEKVENDLTNKVEKLRENLKIYNLRKSKVYSVRANLVGVTYVLNRGHALHLRTGKPGSVKAVTGPVAEFGSHLMRLTRNVRKS